MKINPALQVLLIAVLLSPALNVRAQKLPRIQEQNMLLATHSIRIDGRLGDWEQGVAAYNKPFGVYYSVANDDQNLYLVIRSANRTSAKKMVVGGVTFTVGQSDRKAEENHSSVTFPYYDRNTPSWFISFPAGSTDARQNDSLLAAYNGAIAVKFRTIGVRGFKSVTDSLISIYNEEGIKAAAQFDKDLSYCYELAIPLKLLGITANAAKLSYTIKLNGIPIHGTNLQLQTYGRDIISYTGYNGANVQVGKATPEMIELVLPTDFSGQYDLVFK